jgi:hypothetical protein
VKETFGGGRTGSLMPDLIAKRTLVKSPPELWEELSEVDRLAKHLDSFGEIRITKLEPEHTVAWEGEHASGTVSIEPSGWGTKVTLTAELPEAEPPEPAPEPDPEPAPLPEPEPVPEEPAPPEPVAEEPVAEDEVPPAKRRRGFWAWLFRERTTAQAPAEAEPEPESEPELEPEPELEAEEPESEPVEPVATVEPEPEPVEPDPPAVEAEHAQTALEDMLESLGSAHHRPYSRG